MKGRILKLGVEAKEYKNRRQLQLLTLKHLNNFCIERQHN